MKYLVLLLKGMAMGAANVIPGVSGGTIALITGIFEELIDAIKSFDTKALKLLKEKKFKELVNHIHLWFLLAVFGGIAISIITFAKLFGYLFENYPVYLWSFFFGLILASVYYVGKTVNRINLTSISFFVVGTAIAVGITLFNPAMQNDAWWYLLICGVVAMISMILPGLSGSFVLILLGNYQLVMIDAVNNLDLAILLPVAIGAGIGLLAFSRLLSWIFKNYHDQTLAVLTGFILGSLSTLWPWKHIEYLKNTDGSVIFKHGKPIVSAYHKFFPTEMSSEVVWALVFMVLGILSIVLVEFLAKKEGD